MEIHHTPFYSFLISIRKRAFFIRTTHREYEQKTVKNHLIRWPALPTMSQVKLTRRSLMGKHWSDDLEINFTWEQKSVCCLRNIFAANQEFVHPRIRSLCKRQSASMWNPATKWSPSCCMTTNELLRVNSDELLIDVRLTVNSSTFGFELRPSLSGNHWCIFQTTI